MELNTWLLVPSYKMDCAERRNEEQLPFPMLAPEYLKITQFARCLLLLHSLIRVLEPLIFPKQNKTK